MTSTWPQVEDNSTQQQCVGPSFLSKYEKTKPNKKHTKRICAGCSLKDRRVHTSSTADAWPFHKCRNLCWEHHSHKHTDKLLYSSLGSGKKKQQKWRESRHLRIYLYIKYIYFAPLKARVAAHFKVNLVSTFLNWSAFELTHRIHPRSRELCWRD